jgi:hypothetical protein
MPYFTHARIQANCERGISLGGGAAMIEVSGSSDKIGADREIIGRTRGLRAVPSTASTVEPDGLLTGFDVNSASAAWRAFVIRS